jgi:hypothetical protein
MYLCGNAFVRQPASRLLSANLLKAWMVLNALRVGFDCKGRRTSGRSEGTAGNGKPAYIHVAYDSGSLTERPSPSR